MPELKYETDTKLFSELKGKIEIPRFQRGLVWGKDKKREFIRSLKAGLPIGVLLLAPKGDKWLVIDGLQRFTTMQHYANNYFEYIDRDEITDIDLSTIIAASPDAKQVFDAFTQDAKEKQFDEMRDIIVSNMGGLGQGKNEIAVSRSAAEELCRKIAALPDKDMVSILEAVHNIVSGISKKAEIDSIPIPLIIFKGREDELANIFQKLNQEGVKLSKYDVFAATWINHSVVIKDDAPFIQYIINKYEAAQNDSDLDIADYDPDAMKQSGELTVFEYAYAVGKALKEKCKKLFPKANDDKVDSIGFLILAELMGLTYQSMGKLAETIDSYKNLDFKRLKDAILEVGGIVESALGKYIESPSKSGKSLACHSELQLASYIIVIFKLKYDLSCTQGLQSKNDGAQIIKKVKHFLPKHYLYDILRGFWSGSGDSKLEEIISNPQICRYTKDVAKDDFEIQAANWLQAMNDKNGQTNVSIETKLFLNYLLRLRIPDIDRHDYDVEHCVPKDVIKKYLGKRVPISPACNLIYIPATDNRSKKESTYYQLQDEDPATFTLNQDQLDLLVYPTRPELRFVESTATLTEENYLAFLRDRKQVILNALMSGLYGN